MAYVQQTFMHTLESAPTTLATLYVEHYKTHANIAPSEAVRTTFPFIKQLSEYLYKDIKTLLIDAALDDNDFPFELEFVEDADIVYTNAQKMPKFRIGTMSYGTYVTKYAVNGNDTYTPWTTAYYSQVKSREINPELAAEGKTTSSYNPFRTLASILVDGLTFEYTLYLHYNTDFIVLSFTTRNLSIVTPLIMQAKAKDRFLNDWYMIGRQFGCCATSDYIYCKGPEFRKADNADAGLSGSHAIYFDEDTIVDAEQYTTNVYVSPMTISPTNKLEGAQLPILSPCANYNSSVGTGAKYVINLQDLSIESVDPSKVCVASPILLQGMLQLTSQIKVASPNIINNREYVIGNKRYFCFGNPQVQALPVPFLFEIGEVE